MAVLQSFVTFKSNLVIKPLSNAEQSGAYKIDDRQVLEF